MEGIGFLGWKVDDLVIVVSVSHETKGHQRRTDSLVGKVNAACAALNGQRLSTFVRGRRCQGETGAGRGGVDQAFVGKADKTFPVMKHHPAVE